MAVKFRNELGQISESYLEAAEKYVLENDGGEAERRIIKTQW